MDCIGRDETNSCVILADTGEEAKKIALKRCIYFPKEARLRCSKLGVSVPSLKVKRVVIEDFNAP